MASEDRDDRDFTEEAADALEESRRRAGEEGRTIEEQPDPLTVEEDDGDVRAF